MTPKLHWTPSPQYVRDSNYDAFRRYLNQRHGTDFKPTAYWDLHAWAISSPENINHFWTALWDFGGVIGDKRSAPVRVCCHVAIRDDQLIVAFLRADNQLFDAWSPMSKTRDRFGDARLNWAENMLLAHPHARSSSQMAVVSLVESRQLPTAQERIAASLVKSLTYAELYTEVAQAASSLKKLGLSAGDRVAALTPNNAGM
jgi:acetoacetyl-CoA synthetase